MTSDTTIFTVGNLREHLEDLPDNTELIFQNGLTFYRVKGRGENLVQIEFNELFVVTDD